MSWCWKPWDISVGDYLEFGFVGFNNMSDEDLRVEYESAFGVDDDREYEDER
jgi:hypothetical protein